VSISPSPFIVRWLPIVRNHLGPKPELLDIAMGTGRHAREACCNGFHIYGVDHDYNRIKQAKSGVLREAKLWVADLTLITLPRNRFDLIICTNYLQRTIWPCLRASIRPGGFILYETFTRAQLQHRAGPKSPEHLLRLGELREQFIGWKLIHDEERISPDAMACLVARKPR